jgi:F-type H+-transporting ATPase subunit delta
MKTDIAAKRYAQAAFQVALEKGDPERWLGDLDTLVDLVSQPEAMAVLQSDRVPESEKERLLRAALPDVDPAVLNLARLLVAKRRIGLTADVRDEFSSMLDAYRGRARGSVTTAIPLSGDQKTQIAQKLSQITGKTVDLQAQVDPNIVGGLVARVGDTLIDGSTRSKLVALKRALRGGGGWVPALDGGSPEGG